MIARIAVFSVLAVFAVMPAVASPYRNDPPVHGGPSRTQGSGTRLWEGDTGIVTHAKDDEDDGTGGCTRTDRRPGCG